MLPDLERRAIAVGVTSGKIVGHAVIFDVRSQDLGGFVEIVRPQAVNRALTDEANVIALYQHDPAAVLGRTPKTLRLAKDARGLAFELTPAPTQTGRDVLQLVDRGDVAGASFGFRTLRDNWQKDGELIVRELLDIEIAEISLTAFPAYSQTDVQVAQRALRGFHQAQAMKRIDYLRRRLRVLSTRSSR